VTGDREGLLRNLPDLKLAGASRGWQADILSTRAWGYAVLGDRAAAEAEIAQIDALAIAPDDQAASWLGNLFPVIADYGIGSLESMSSWAEARSSMRYQSAYGWFRRMRGMLALRAGDLGEAETELELALEECTDNGLQLEVGRCHQGLAELAELQDDHDRALEHLDAAGDLYARVGAGGYLNEVIAKKEILKA